MRTPGAEEPGAAWDARRPVLRALALLLLLASWLPLGGALGDGGTTIEGMLPAHELERQAELRKGFAGPEEMMLVALDGASWREGEPEASEQLIGSVAEESAPRIAALVRELERIEGVERVRSLPRRSADSTLLVAELARETLELERARRVTRAFSESLVAATRAGERSAFAGRPRLRADSWRLARRDLVFLLPLLSLLALGLPRLFFGAWSGSGFLLLCAGGTSAATLWAMRLVEGSVNVQMLLILPVLWAAAAMDALHLSARLAIDGAGTRAALRAVRAPCVTTTLTTAIGLALIGAGGESELLRGLGVWAASGVVLALALTFALAPLWFGPHPPRTRAARWPLAVGCALVRGARRRPRTVVLASVVLGLGALFSATRLRIDARYPHLFAPHTELARDLVLLGEVSGTDLNPLELLLVPSRDTRPVELANALIAIEQQLATIEEQAFVLPGFSSMLRALRSEDTPGRSHDFAELDWETVAEILEEQPELARWVDAERGIGRVQLFLRPVDQGRKQQLLEQLAGFDRAMLSSHELEPWGTGVTTHRIERLGVRDLVEGGLLTAGVMLVVLVLALGGWWAGLIALACSLLPLVVVAGAMGATGLPWSIVLLPLPGALLGIGVDDSIHMLWGSAPRGRGHGRLRAVPALVATTLLFVGCALALEASSLEANRAFGRLLALGMLAALVLDLCLLPALARTLGRGPRRSGSLAG